MTQDRKCSYAVSSGFSLTFNAELETDVAEGHSPRVCLQLTNTADVVIIQVYVHKLFLLIHGVPAETGSRENIKGGMFILKVHFIG